MTERKPAGTSFESWVEQQISEAVRRGDLEGLPGAGKPLPPGDDDENWWLRGYLRRNEAPAGAALPVPMQLRKEADEIDDTVRELRSEDAVRRAVADLNGRIVDSWRKPNDSGLFARQVDVEAVVERWRAHRVAGGPEPAPAPEPGSARPPRRWWQRLTGRRPDLPR